MKIQCEHIAANCNPMPNTLLFIDQDRIAFCFSNQVGIYSFKRGCIITNVNTRTIKPSRANCLKSLTMKDGHILIVGYDSGNLCIFTEKNDDAWILRQTVKQNSALTFIESIGNTVLTGNISAQITYYEMNSAHQEIIKEKNQLKFPLGKTPESISLFEDKHRYIIFIGGADQKIHCYAQTADNPFEYQFSLSGHENAITKLSVIEENGEYLLASSSKDGYIRLWRITKDCTITKFHKNVQKLDVWHIFLDSVLVNHECSVTNLCWASYNSKLQLISCSLDCTICLWVKSEQDSWEITARMGQFIGNKNAYFNVVTDPIHKYLVAVNYIGSVMIWAYDNQNHKFNLQSSFNGHSSEVTDIDWDSTGNFLVSVSMDQTTRIISYNSALKNYHEISRAQIHGYDINAVSTVKVNDAVIDVIACGADEKVIRIVEPPACFANFLNSATKANLHLYFPSVEEENRHLLSSKTDETLLYKTYTEGCTQVLGLMTKMQRIEKQKVTSYYDDEDEQAQEEESSKLQQLKQANTNFTLPPHDDYLIKHTLWPEMQKLYGHPHEISSLARCNRRKLLASSCSGLNKVASTMIIWETEGWKIVKMIEHHSYTVYDIKFSQCGKYLASVSKDRKLAVFDEQFNLMFSYEAHTRAVNSVSFSPNSQIIATGSRDKSIKLHSIADKSIINQLPTQKSVSAVQFCRNDLLAAGLEDGSIILLTVKDLKLQMVLQIDDRYGSLMEITALKWNRNNLACSSKDHSIRIFSIHSQ